MTTAAWSGSRFDAYARRLGLTWAFLLAALAALAVTGLMFSVWASKTTVYFLVAQDLGLLALETAILALAYLASLRVAGGGEARAGALVARWGSAICVGLAILVAAAAFVGWNIVFQRFSLTKDELWASFDTRIFEHGRFVAEVAPQWRPFVPALQPEWRMQIAGDRAWVSTYLPMNAAFRALFGLVGSPALAGPFWAALSVIAVFALARRYWPQRPDAAVVAALLMATSAQVVITAMTTYAMSPLLALNLVWLWFFQSKGAPSQLAAVVVAFAASGLHQLIFHPLFAFPFVLQAWLRRDWRRAAFHTLAYALICLFWASYGDLMLKAQGLAAASPSGLGPAGFVGRAAAMLGSFDVFGPMLIAADLLRFIAWQNPLAIVLGAVGWVAAIRRRDGATWPLAAGLALTLVAMAVLEPDQGHGWGYRYLHGLIGSLCLLAAATWTRVVEPNSPTARRAWAALGVTAAASAFVTIPLCAFQTFQFIQPYARAEASISRAPADIVVVDPTGLWYGEELVRNDPFLRDAPKVMNLGYLTDDDLRSLCRGHRVALFDRRLASELGVRTFEASPYPHVQALRAVLAQPPCTGLVVAKATPDA